MLATAADSPSFLGKLAPERPLSADPNLILANSVYGELYHGTDFVITLYLERTCFT